MATETSIPRMLSSVRIYWDPQAFRSDEFGRPQYLEMKPCHDALYEEAIARGLATRLVFRERRASRGRGTSQELREVCTVAATRPSWWPANRVDRGRADLLQLPLAALKWRWQDVLRAAQPSPKQVSIWHEDPALVFDAAGAVWCRTACVGHAGHVYYFVYGTRERQWEASIVRHALELFGEGEGAYRRLVPQPGTVAG